MAENDRHSGYAIINAIRAQRQLGDATDRTHLEDTLVKSVQWKKNTLAQIANDANGNDDRHAESEERRQAEMLRRCDDESYLLRQTIARLEAENATLVAQHQSELDERRDEMLEFQQAFDQFQKESDLLINELDEEVQRLRNACKLTNRRSLL